MIGELNWQQENNANVISPFCIAISYTRMGSPDNLSNLTVSPYLQSEKGVRPFGGVFSMLIDKEKELQPELPSQVEQSELVQFQEYKRVPSTWYQTVRWTQYTSSSNIFNQGLPSEPGCELDRVLKSRSMALLAPYVGSILDCLAPVGVNSPSSLFLVPEMKGNHVEYFDS